ncbi:phage tail protein [Escherichia albertii]|uniref:Phage tail protein n=1 Tax=Escherichia albertii TaxID=208962 RepID=A0AAX3MGI7_ESCAL|nr:phage tail protein [Escherichia albertii]AUS65847.1 phage tail protein [Escherichia albertii]EAB1451035.1 phage tail protein [Escherichia albertii]EEW7340464.1 phage tail protein [Escherichia albertii]EJM1768837.1 phage tail protein [Escherichia albertii]EJM9604221.1 phage tail protein [Escherichia albertii]
MAKLKSNLKASASQVYAVLTDRGAQLEAAALASGVPVVLNKFVIGDANGNDDVTPDPARTVLIHETYRGDIKSSENSGNQVIFTLYVPPETGGYTIREVGILTDKGELYSVARSPDILKPTNSNGALISITYKYTLAVSSTSTVNVVIDNSSGMSQADADKRYLQISKNLSEIKNKGAAAQKEGRENLDIDLDSYYKKTEIDDKFSEIDTEIGNIKPVLTVNGISPDENGNVNTSSGLVKVNGDGAFNLVLIYEGQLLTIFPAMKIVTGFNLTPTSISTGPASVAPTGELCGSWRTLAATIRDDPVLVQRIPIGDISKMRNIREPFYPKKSAGGSSNHSYICVVCDIDGIDEEVIFTSCLNDVEEYGVQVFQNAKNGMYGTVTEGRIVN